VERQGNQLTRTGVRQTMILVIKFGIKLRQKFLSIIQHSSFLIIINFLFISSFSYNNLNNNDSAIVQAQTRR
jgi:hypothetical protein